MVNERDQNPSQEVSEIITGHASIDLFGASHMTLGSEVIVRNLLNELPAKIGLETLYVPNVYQYQESKPENWGISGFVLLTTSHIAIHTFPEHGQAWCDFFSSGKYDIGKAVEILTATFEASNSRVHQFDRKPGDLEQFDPEANTRLRDEYLKTFDSLQQSDSR